MMQTHVRFFFRHVPFHRQTARIAIGVVVAWVFGGFPVHAQLRIPMRGSSIYPDASPVSVFMPAPRELQRELARAVEDIEQERYVDGITRLDLILRGDNEQNAEFAEDYFLPQNGNDPVRSLKLEAERLISTLPKAGLEAYELAYGTEARQSLDRAIERRDFDAVAEISRRFGNTRAGQEATMLLGRDRFSRGRFVEALLHFRRLADHAEATRRFGAELQFLLAATLSVSHRDSEAQQVLESHATQHPDATIRIRGQQVDWPRPEAQPLEWLASVVGQIPASQARPLDEWPMFGGNTRRTGVADVDMPLRSMRWDLPFAVDPKDETQINRQAKALGEQAVTPVLHPLVVDGWVLMRSADALWGVELSSGSRIWEFPWSRDSEIENVQTQLAPGGARRTTLLKQRVWHDCLYGQLSSDGQVVYVLNQLTGDYHDQSNGLGLTNELVALELAREGYSLWMVGGDDGHDEPELAGIFFLGAPLPVNDRLYCIGEVNGEIRLVVLESQSGKLLWSQQLAHVDSRSVRDRNGGFRRMAGLNPSYADGILVCPTSVGGVVAIDVARQTLLWGYQYIHTYDRRKGYVNSSTVLTDSWRDNAVTIHRGRVVLTPWDSQELYCLDLLTGEPVWKQPKPRGTNLFVAGMEGGNIVLVGQQSVSAMDLETGEDRWTLPLRDPPSGRGVQSGSEYLLATSTPELIRIDLQSGTITEAIATDEPLGNLVTAGDQLITQNERRLRSFYQKSKLQERLSEALAKNPHDPWALEHQALLLLERGERAAGLQTLRQALEHYPDDDSGDDVAAKDLMIRTSLDMLRENVPGSAELAKEIKSLIAGRPDIKNEFLRVVTLNLRRGGQLTEAFKHNLELFESYRARQLNVAIRDSVELMPAGKHRTIQQARWHRALFRDLWNDADTLQRDAMQELALASLEQAGHDQLDTVVSVLQDLPFMVQKQLDMIREQLESKRTTALTEIKLLRFARERDPSTAAQSLALLAELYRSAGRYAAAADSYRRLASEFAEVEVQPGVSGASFARASIDANATVRGIFESTAQWPLGQVKVVASSEPPSRSGYGDLPPDTLNGLLSLSSEQPYAQSPYGMQLVFDQLAKTLQARDSMGKPHVIASLSSVLPGVRGRDLRVRTNGHFIVGVRGESLVALDGLASATESQSILWQDTGQQPSPYSSSITSLRTIRFSDQLKLTRSIENSRGGRSPLSVGPVTEYGLVVRRYGELMCLDLLTGEPIWVRSDVDLDAEVWGDADRVFVHVPGKTPGNDRNARVFSTIDGAELESVPVADQRHRIRAFGRHVLSWHYDVALDVPAEEGVVLNQILKREEVSETQIPPGTRDALLHRIQLNDILNRTETAVWVKTFSYQSRAAFVGENELAVYDAKRQRIHIFSILDGRDIVDFEVQTELPEVDEINVEKRAGLYAVSLLQHTTGREKSRVIHRSPHSSTKLSNLEVYAFNDAGEMVWEAPARFSNFIQAPIFAANAPVLVFLRTDERPSKRILDTVVLDIRDGHAMFTDSSQLDGQVFEVRCDKDTNSIGLRVPADGGSWKIELTDAARPPGRPYGHDESAAKTGDDPAIKDE